MKKTIQLLAFVVVCCLSLQGYAQKGLMWEISGNGLSAPSYLYGTIHIACEADVNAKLPMIQTAVGSVEQICLEMDMDDPNTMMEMKKGMVSKDGKNFSDQLSEENYKLVNDYLTKNFGAGLAQMGMLKPWMLGTMISLHDIADCKKAQGFEAAIIQLAMKEKREVVGLEEPAEQFAIFDVLTLKEQLELLVEAITEKEEQKKQFKQLLAHYNSENLTEMLKYMLEQPEMKKLKKSLLDDRNVKWIPLMVEMMKGKTTLFAVGAGHLSGDKGVIALLKAKGYNVKRVK